MGVTSRNKRYILRRFAGVKAVDTIGRFF